MGARTRRDWIWWNIGGGCTSRHGLEGGGLPDSSVPGRIETGRWYDIKVEVHGAKVTCYLDGKVVHRVTRSPIPWLASTAGWTAKGDELILKVVNGGGKPMDAQVSLRGIPDVKPTAHMISMTGSGPAEENSFANPHNISVQEQTIEGIGPEFRHTFPASTSAVTPSLDFNCNSSKLTIPGR